MKKNLVLIWLLLSGPLAWAQSEPVLAPEKKVLSRLPETTIRISKMPAAAKQTQKPNLKERAATQIKDLKDGVLLVRLRTSENAIQKLTEAGNEKMAATIRRQQETSNQRLMQAFRENYTFSPVYFFYSSASQEVKDGNPVGIFLNEDLQPDPAIILPDRNIFVAEITDLEQYRPDPENPNASINSEISFRALVVRDSALHQLAKPFPYFIKATTTIPPRRRSEAEMVSLLNKKLEAFYKKSVFGRSW
ncbi:MAG TPA: hypothetical protein VK927_08935 [Adhaeribacter sp.]|nr:hypothetical protein [Adhaeribacter sp.]